MCKECKYDTNGELEVLNDWDGYKFFRTSCHCKSEDHNFDITLEGDKDHDWPMYSMTFYKKVYGAYYGDSKWERFKWKVKTIWTFITQGYIETHEDFIFRGEEQIRAVANCINQGLDNLKKEKENVVK